MPKQEESNQTQQAASNEVSAKITKFGAVVTAEANIFGTSLEDLIANIVATGKADEARAKEIVYSNAIAAMKVTLQSAMRRWAVVTDAETKEDSLVSDPDIIQTKVDAWVPGIIERSKKSTQDKMKEYFDSLPSEEAKAQFLASLQARAAGE